MGNADPSCFALTTVTGDFFAADLEPDGSCRTVETEWLLISKGGGRVCRICKYVGSTCRFGDRLRFRLGMLYLLCAKTLQILVLKHWDSD